jgi:hypothetical protein
VLLDAAVRDNAEWCDLMCRTHRLSGELGSAVWSCPTRTPPFYPDAITLRPGVAAEEVLDGIDRGPGCSVKDSFADADLTPAGFRVLFEADWIAAPPPDPREPWDVVRDARALAEWERALGDDTDGLFRPALLASAGVEFVAARAEGRIVSGAQLTGGTTVVGVYNLFSATGDLDLAYAGALATAAARFPGLPVVGYEHGDRLAAALRHGFEVIGPLRIWLRAG